MHTPSWKIAVAWSLCIGVLVWAGWAEASESCLPSGMCIDVSTGGIVTWGGAGFEVSFPGLYKPGLIYGLSYEVSVHGGKIAGVGADFSQAAGVSTLDVTTSPAGDAAIQITKFGPIIAAGGVTETFFSSEVTSVGVSETLFDHGTVASIVNTFFIPIRIWTNEFASPCINNFEVCQGGGTSLSGSDDITVGDLVIGRGGDGTLDAVAATLTADTLRIGGDASGAATVQLDGTISTRSLVVGDQSNGELDILSGGTVKSFSLAMGENAGATGTVNIDGGSLSVFSNTDMGTFGGTAAIDVVDGGTFSTGSLTVGTWPSIGSVTVSGEGSSLAARGDVVVGNSASGFLHVGEGATMIAGSLSAGRDAGSTARIELYGGSLSLANLTTGTVTIGESGFALLDMASGARLATANLVAGLYQGSTGVISVSDSRIDALTVLITGSGLMTMANRGFLSAQQLLIGQGPQMTITIGHDVFANGTVDVTDGSSILISRLTTGLPTPRILVGALGDGALNIDGNGSSVVLYNNVDYTDPHDPPIIVVGTPDYHGNVTISGGASLQFFDTTKNKTGGVDVEAQGTVSITGNGSRLMVIGGDFTNRGNVTITGGTALLSVTGSYAQKSGLTKLDGGTLHTDGGVIMSDGEIGGKGTLDSDVTVHGGMVHVGASPDQLAATGNFTQDGGRVVFEIDPDGHGGFLESTLLFKPTANLDFSNTVFEFDFLGGADPNLFLADGLFDLNTFFKVADHPGFADNLAFLNAFPNAPGGQDFTDVFDAASIFTDDSFETNSPGWLITGFDPTSGQLNVQSGPDLPEPGTFPLFAAALVIFRSRCLKPIKRRSPSA